MPLKTRCRGLGRCVCVWLHRINGVPGPGGRGLGAAGTVRALCTRLWEWGPLRQRVCVGGSFVPSPRPLCATCPPWAARYFWPCSAVACEQRWGRPEGILVRGAAPRVYSPMVGRRNLGGRVAVRYRARPGGGTAGRRLRGAGRVVAPAAPAACSDRLGSAAACGARAALAEALYPSV